MLVIDQVVIQDAVLESVFVCDIEACKGACCEAGDFGAPLDVEEIDHIEANLSGISDFMSEVGKLTLQTNGFYTIDGDGDLTTETIDHKECVFAVKDTSGKWVCSIEKAWQAGKSDFQKPISCHLYPIRIKKTANFEVLHYHVWNICSAACILGKKTKVKLYAFLKTALVRKYGADWYAQIEAYETNNLKK